MHINQVNYKCINYLSLVDDYIHLFEAEYYIVSYNLLYKMVTTLRNSNIPSFSHVIKQVQKSQHINLNTYQNIFKSSLAFSKLTK